jgi:RNA-directed DNA polymerase
MLDCNGPDTDCNIIGRESGQTSDWSVNTRELGEPTKEMMQMSADTTEPAGAVSHETDEWHDIDWDAVHRNVRRLQARIVKATKEGKWGRVKALQRLLTHSFSGKALAVRRVTENQGKNTPGVDKVTWSSHQSKTMAIRSLKQKGYNPQPLRRVYIPKSNGKLRPLGIPTMKDRAMQALYLLALDPISECLADPNSYGFRKERACRDAMEQCYNALGKGKSPQWVLDADIKGCFDNISHDWLTANIPMDKTILRKWLKSGYIEKSAIHKTEDGTPQGGIISPVLANMALDGLERCLREKYPLETRKQYRAQVNMVRYADDFIITGASKEILEGEVKPLVVEFLRERNLELSEEKTAIRHIDEGFDFLGQNVRKYNGKCLIKPSKKNVKTFLDNVRATIKGKHGSSAIDLIAALNPKIIGWGIYHRHAVSAKTFANVDNAIYKAIWRWALRGHPKKTRRWIRKQYFCTVKGNNWVFFDKTQDRNGETLLRFLKNMTSIHIKRHTKIKSAANPYDPQWETYFETRLGLKMEATLHGRRKLSNLWKEQDGTCPVCNQKITKLTGWHNHHIERRADGGSDRSENRVLLHPECHIKVHAKRLTVTKPRPLKGVTQA